MSAPRQAEPAGRAATRGDTSRLRRRPLGATFCEEKASTVGTEIPLTTGASFDVRVTVGEDGRLTLARS